MHWTQKTHEHSLVTMEKRIIVIGKIRLHQAKPGEQIELVHVSKHGEIKVSVPADTLRRWAMRILREEAFK